MGKERSGILRRAMNAVEHEWIVLFRELGLAEQRAMMEIVRSIVSRRQPRRIHIPATVDGVLQAAISGSGKMVALKAVRAEATGA